MLKLYSSPTLDLVKFFGTDVLCSSTDGGFTGSQNQNDNDYEWGWEE